MSDPNFQAHYLSKMLTPLPEKKLLSHAHSKVGVTNVSNLQFPMNPPFNNSINSIPNKTSLLGGLTTPTTVFPQTNNLNSKTPVSPTPLYSNTFNTTCKLSHQSMVPSTDIASTNMPSIIPSSVPIVSPSPTTSNQNLESIGSGNIGLSNASTISMSSSSSLNSDKMFIQTNPTQTVLPNNITQNTTYVNQFPQMYNAESQKTQYEEEYEDDYESPTTASGRRQRVKRRNDEYDSPSKIRKTTQTVPAMVYCSDYADDEVITRVKEILERDNISQKTLAKDLGFSGSTLSPMLKHKYKHTKQEHINNFRFWIYCQDRRFIEDCIQQFRFFKVSQIEIAEMLKIDLSIMNSWIQMSNMEERSEIDNNMIKLFNMLNQQRMNGFEENEEQHTKTVNTLLSLFPSIEHSAVLHMTASAVGSIDELVQ